MSLSMMSVMHICLRAGSGIPQDSRPCEFDEEAVLSSLRAPGQKYVYDAASEFVLLPRCVSDGGGSLKFYALTHTGDVCYLRQEGLQLVVDQGSTISPDIARLFAEASIDVPLKAEDVFNCESVVPPYKLKEDEKVWYVCPHAIPPSPVVQNVDDAAV